MKGHILKYAGVACIPLYIIFTFVSYLYNPEIKPLTNWLSDYGNPILNPSGALIYNLGCILTAVLLCLFYLGMSKWYAKRSIAKKYIICYICAQALGIIAAVFLVLASLIPLGVNDDLHGTFSMLNMIGMDCFLSFTAIAIFLNPGIKKWIGILGYAAAVFNIVTMNAFSDFYLSEWIFFLLFMVYISLITTNYNKFWQNENVKPQEHDALETPI